MPPKSSYREVGTKESAADIPKFNKSASKWTKTDLKLLGVDYQYDDFEESKMERVQVPDELSQGYDTLSETDM
jgi:hypothetical protein